MSAMPYDIWNYSSVGFMQDFFLVNVFVSPEFMWVDFDNSCMRLSLGKWKHLRTTCKSLVFPNKQYGGIWHLQHI